MLDAACTQTDPDHFFADEHEIGRAAARQATKAAISICKTCPVRLKCLTYARTNGIRLGVWGGVAARPRTEMRS